jgi:hypothetical protein
MMAPMQRGHDHDTGDAQSDHAEGGFGRKFVLHNQGRQTRDQQQGRDTAENMRAVMVMMATAMHVVAMMVVTMPAPVAAFMAVVGAFVEREFIAHADIKFAHKSPWIRRPQLAARRISSYNHQKSIIVIK